MPFLTRCVAQCSRGIEPRLIEFVTLQLERILSEARCAGHEVLEATEGIHESLISAFHTVYRHDTWTCPVTVQHALQEIARVYEIASDPLRLLMEDFTYSFAIDAEDSPDARSRLERLHGTTRESLSLPSLEDIDVYISQVEEYLSTDRGSL